jgi:hypothetical protein
MHKRFWYDPSRKMVIGELITDFNVSLMGRAPCKGGVFPVGESPTRQLSLQPEAIGAVMEVTKWLEPPV